MQYARDIKPVLKAKCFSCHGAIEQESELRVDTVELMKSGGDSGPVIVPGDAESSLLIERVTATDEFERMPPEGEPLSHEQIDRFQAWIEAGATGPADESPQGDPKAHWAFQKLTPVSPPARSSDRDEFDRQGSALLPPTDQRPAYRSSGVDVFIHGSLRAAGIDSAPPADAGELVRRMFLDLHGLLPTPQQVARWRNRIGHDRAETVALIDELLSSPRYGERWAQHWLDVVRYADTHGFEVNTSRDNAWPYRDYVITSFNQDKPYDQFVIEQLAGDAVGQDAATGFMVAAAALLPGQIGKDDESKRLARQDELDEIIVGTSATFLGLTVGCARCHDHKFDPIPQQDYYAMQAFFAGVDYGDREIRGQDYDQKMADASRLQVGIDRLGDQLNQFFTKSFPGRTIVIDDEDLDQVTLLKEKNGHGVNPDGTQRGYRGDRGDSRRVGNLGGGRYTWWDNVACEDVFTWNPNERGRFRLWVSWGVHGSGIHTRDARYVIDFDGDLSTTADQSEIARADQYRFAGGGQGKTKKVPLWSGLSDAGVHEFDDRTRLILRGGETGTGITADVIVLQECLFPEDKGRTAPLLRAPVSAIHTVERFEPTDAKFVRFTTFATIDDDKHEPCIDELEVFTASESPVNIAVSILGTKATSSGNYSNAGKHQLKHINDGRYGNSRSWISNEHGRGWVQLEFPQVAQIDRVEWSRDRESKFKDRLPVRYEIATSMDATDWTVVASSRDRVPLQTPFDEIQSLIRNGSRGDAHELAAMVMQQGALQRQQTKLRKTKKVFAGKFRPAKATFVLNRGDPEQPTGEIEPHVLTAIGSLSLAAQTPERDRRMALAQWIASADNPLTARVMVNRIWQYHFGVGLVETSSDFGLNGAAPSHPELLDWLSVEFIRSGWSMKHLHRLIMSSQTYQQSSVWVARESGPVARESGPVARESGPVALRSGPQQTKLHEPPIDPAIVDADCKLLWRFPTRRMEAEAIRDCMLQVSGQLNLETGGPGFDFFKTRGGLTGFPPLQQFGANELRRMVYAHKVRMERVPVFGTFDCPDAGLPTPRRGQSTTAIQALNLFNSPFVISQADAFATRIEHDAEGTAGQIDLAYQLAFGRSPREHERIAVERVVNDHGLATLCRVLFNSSEFLFIP